MNLNDNLDFLLSNGGCTSINDGEFEVASITFGDGDNPKIFSTVENDESIVVLVLENIYDGIEVGDNITDFAKNNIRNDLLDGKIRSYISFCFPKTESGNKGIDSLINNLVNVQKYLRKWN